MTKGGVLRLLCGQHPSAVAEQYVVRHYTRDPDHGMYGLIDNEKS